MDIFIPYLMFIENKCSEGSIFPPFKESINLSIYQSISLSIYQSINLSIYQSINLSIYQSICYPLICLSICYPFICLSICYPFICLSICYPLICLSICYPFICLSILVMSVPILLSFHHNLSVFLSIHQPFIRPLNFPIMLQSKN